MKNRICFLLTAIFLFSCSSSVKTISTEPKQNPVSSEIDSSQVKSVTEVKKTEDSDTSISKASQLVIKSCNNYIELNPTSPKIPQVKLLKASVYYNNGRFDLSRKIYEDIIKSDSTSVNSVEAVRMIAQSFYEEKKFNEAQTWYRKLKKIAKGKSNKTEAVKKIAESMFKMADNYDKSGNLGQAAETYERIAIEFPTSKIADISLYNSALAYEKLANWSRAILVYQKLKNTYSESPKVPEAMFRIAKCYEKQKRWTDAAESYLRLVASYPTSTFTQTALYNAAFCFENDKKYKSAAITFEKLAELFPNSNDAPDVIFKAGELFGKIKDWEAVRRINTIFYKRYGTDKDRVVQALCMVGVAMYMQDKTSEALSQLRKAVSTYSSIKSNSVANKYYAAKAQFTIAEIYYEMMKNIKLVQPRSVYQKNIKIKSSILDKTVETYSNVVQYGIAEWTTRSIFSIGKSYEAFANDIMSQERPKYSSLKQELSLELGIAEAFDKYMINNALHYHEQNIKLAIKEHIENKYVKSSREMLTYLPYLVAKNYITLTRIGSDKSSESTQSGFALIAKKLDNLQLVGPFREKAMVLYLKTLELGVKYKIKNDYFDSASANITGVALDVADNYSYIVDIARNAPIPKELDSYERYTYKINLLSQITSYEDNALTNYLKGIKIAMAYDISDSLVDKCKSNLAELIFKKGRCYDLLAIEAISNPPFPSGISDIEKEEYTAKFEEVAMNYEDQAIQIYSDLLKYFEKSYVMGKFVDQAYVRLYQLRPDKYGVKTPKNIVISIKSDPLWKCNSDSEKNWYDFSFNDSSWNHVKRIKQKSGVTINGFPGVSPVGMWFVDSSGFKPEELFFRRTFNMKELSDSVILNIAAVDEYEITINGKKIPKDTSETYDWRIAKSINITRFIVSGENIIAIKVRNSIKMDYGLFVQIDIKSSTYEYLPKLPGREKTSDKNNFSEKNYTFEKIPNFEIMEEK